jgi:hypothetical protein
MLTQAQRACCLTGLDPLNKPHFTTAKFATQQGGNTSPRPAVAHSALQETAARGTLLLMGTQQRYVQAWQTNSGAHDYGMPF